MCITIAAHRGNGCLTGRTNQQKARRGQSASLWRFFCHTRRVPHFVSLHRVSMQAFAGYLTSLYLELSARRGHVCLTGEVIFMSHSQGTSLCIASPGRHASLCRVPHELLPGALTGRTTHPKSPQGHGCLMRRTTTNGPQGAKLFRGEDNHQRPHRFQDGSQHGRLHCLLEVLQVGGCRHC